jgi:hypothetical protein
LRVASDDSFEASRLLAPNFLERSATHVMGALICAIPDRSTLLFAGDLSVESVAHLADVAERHYAASPHALSPALYTIRDDERGFRVVPLRLADDHPLSARVRRAEALLYSHEYAQQKRAYEDLNEAAGDALTETDTPFIGAFLATSRDGEVTTYAVWSDCDTILASADRVMFVVSTDDLLEVRTADARRLVADRLERVEGAWPERWRARTFPSAEQLEELRAVKVGRA